MLGVLVDGNRDCSYLLCRFVLGLLRVKSARSTEYLFGLGAGELRVRVDDVSDLTGDGLARTNFAGLAELDGIVMGLSRGEDDDV